MVEKIKSQTVEPQHLFEVSWEVCNKVGGIHTVISTKALTMTQLMGDSYITIGPDFTAHSDNPEFDEDQSLLKPWRMAAQEQGLRIRVGRWRVNGSPIVMLVDFTPLFAHKDELLRLLWDRFKVDSITGEWDYIEPVIFGYAAGRVIKSYLKHYHIDKGVVAHFHEWMTASGGLFLQAEMPHIATVFTTHATILGRSLAGNHEPLYSNLEIFNSNEFARKYNIFAKYSMERTAANFFDCFATVSDLTAREATYLLGRKPDMVTPNGFENDFVWRQPEFDKKRSRARKAMIEVAQACLGHTFERDPLIIGTSGRYEFTNKGLDLFLDSLKQIAYSDELGREVLAYITVPAGNNGARKDLRDHLADPVNVIDHTLYPHTTHHLSGWDPIVESMANSTLITPQSKVKVIFVPSYLDGRDGIFNMQYYELLVGMDLTVYPSYYEPWGYTPLESVAFSVPTITTTLAGFGLWVAEHTPKSDGVVVITRTDTNGQETTEQIAQTIVRFSMMDTAELAATRSKASEISKIALWRNLIEHYKTAYRMAIKNANNRNIAATYKDEGEQQEIKYLGQQLATNSPTWTRLMVQKTLPEKLRPLEILSNNLWWSWTSLAHELFEYADHKLWAETVRNPIALLDRLSSDRIKELENDTAFLGKLNKTYKVFLDYVAEKKDAKSPKIAYFCMEYGLHSSLKIYSGGLGVLAGDYLKEASDKNVPMVAVGLLYRYGYFTQKLSAQGAQEASYEPENFYKLPISPARDAKGNWVSVELNFPGRIVTARIWKCEVGRTDLYLLDTDHDLNSADDRSITHHLYGGDWENRLKQELLLGIGGVRALKNLGIEQEVYHCNEGHAALTGIERIRNLVSEKKLTFSEALEVVRSSSLFTTHTPVPAGHDAFAESMLRQYLSHYPEKMDITWEQFVSLGKIHPNDPNEKFSMSFLACNLSQEVNGVSWLHGEVSKEILGVMWPGYFKDELSVGYVTNGIHFGTWVAPNLKKIYERYFPEGFLQKEYDIAAWQKVHEVDNGELWEARMFLKEKLIRRIRQRMADPQQMLFASPGQYIKIIDALKPDVLTIGFARRFATYKRANLLFTSLERLDKIVNHPERPVQFVFAGKAHPNDKPGQDLIKRIIEVSAMPQFEGKIIFLQDYNMALARNMVQGVDVWLNTPTRPQEASGTSGQKAVMNGVLQFSVLDGWWVEGYKKDVGWMLPMETTFAEPQYQNELDAEMIYSIIEQEIAPMYYTRDDDNVPYQWVETVKKCIADIGSDFTTNRMLRDYQDRFYNKLYQQNSKLIADNFKMARQTAAWKRRVSGAWDNVRIVSSEQFDMSKQAVMADEAYHISVMVDIANLNPEDIGVELVVAHQIDDPQEVKVQGIYQLKQKTIDGSLIQYVLDMEPENAGSFDLALRVYPKNSNLSHRMDFALVKWA